jgi:hypothetical protein
VALYNFGNMNRDQHQGRDDEDPAEDAPSEPSGVTGWIVLLIIALAAGAYLYFRNR